ncbi:MAG: hypothetical protein JWM82_4021 [Myxococcales bacterium]|nr:hypothetical protein [Myxococcales bacterium]
MGRINSKGDLEWEKATAVEKAVAAAARDRVAADPRAAQAAGTAETCRALRATRPVAAGGTRRRNDEEVTLLPVYPADGEEAAQRTDTMSDADV